MCLPGSARWGLVRSILSGPNAQRRLASIGLEAGDPCLSITGKYVKVEIRHFFLVIEGDLGRGNGGTAGMSEEP